MPERHEVVGIAAHGLVIDHRIPGLGFLLAGMLLHALTEQADVEAGTKRGPRALHHDHLEVAARVDGIDRAANLSPRLEADGVQA